MSSSLSECAFAAANSALELILAQACIAYDCSAKSSNLFLWLTWTLLTLHSYINVYSQRKDLLCKRCFWRLAATGFALFYADLCPVLLKPWLGVRSLPWLVVSSFWDLSSPQTRRKIGSTTLRALTSSFWDAWGKQYNKNTMISPYISANRTWQNLDVFLTLTPNLVCMTWERQQLFRASLCTGWWIKETRPR